MAVHVEIFIPEKSERNTDCFQFIIKTFCVNLGFSNLVLQQMNVFVQRERNVKAIQTTQIWTFIGYSFLRIILVSQKLARSNLSTLCCEDCFERCNKKDGACETGFCGTLFCCKKGVMKNGCDKKNGEREFLFCLN